MKPARLLNFRIGIKFLRTNTRVSNKFIGRFNITR